MRFCQLRMKGGRRARERVAPGPGHGAQRPVSGRRVEREAFAQGLPAKRIGARLDGNPGHDRNGVIAAHATEKREHRLVPARADVARRLVPHRAVRQRVLPHGTRSLGGSIEAQRDHPSLDLENVERLAREVHFEPFARTQQERPLHELAPRPDPVHEAGPCPPGKRNLVPPGIAKRYAGESGAARLSRMKHDLRPPAAGEQQGRIAGLETVAQRRMAERFARQRAAESVDKRSDEGWRAVASGKDRIQCGTGGERGAGPVAA